MHGSTAASDWIQKHRPKVALHPSMTGYCDSRKHLKEQLSRNQAIMNLSHQSGNATEIELLALEETQQHLEEEMKEQGGSKNPKSTTMPAGRNGNNDGRR